MKSTRGYTPRHRGTSITVRVTRLAVASFLVAFLGVAY